MKRLSETGYATGLLAPETPEKRLPGRGHHSGARLVNPVTHWQSLRVLGKWTSVPRAMVGRRYEKRPTGWPQLSTGTEDV